MIKYAKAVVSAVTAGAGTLGVALADNGVTANEWLGVALAVLAALGITAATPNRDARPPRY